MQYVTQSVLFNSIPWIDRVPLVREGNTFNTDEQILKSIKRK